MASAVTGVPLVVGVPGGLAFARFRFPGRGRLILLFRATYR